MNFLRIYTEFQSSPLEIIKKSLEHYSTESMAIQITPWAFSNSNPRSLSGSERGGRWFDRRIRRLGSPAARNRWEKRERGPRRNSRYPWFAERWPERGGPRRTAAVGARSTAAGWFPWGLGEAKGMGGCARMRRSEW